MVGTKLSDRPLVGALATDDVFAIIDTSDVVVPNKKSTMQQILDLVAGTGPIEGTFLVPGGHTADLSTVASLRVAVSGPNAINSFAGSAAYFRFVRVAVAFTLTYNAVTLITPTAANIACKVGDTFLVIVDGSGNAKIYSFVPIDGRNLNTYVAAPPAATGYILWKDATGTVYKVLVAT